MGTVQLELADDVVSLLQELNRPIEDAARELIVLELYRRGAVSSGRAAELLGMEKLAFIRHASSLGIPFFDMTKEEWAAELARVQTL